MKHIFFAVLIGLSLSASASPLWYKNGAGTGEFYMVSALQNAPQFFELCTASVECSDGITQKLNELVSNNVSDLKVRFTTTELPEGMSFRAAATVHSDVVVNQNSLWWEDNGTVLTYDLEQSMALWVRIWGYQLAWNKADIRLVGERLASLVSANIIKTGHPTLWNFSLVRFSDNQKSIIIQDSKPGAKAIAFEAPLSSLNCFEVTGSTAAVSDITILSAFWAQDYNEGGVRKTNVFGKVQYSCDGARFESKYLIKLNLQVDESGSVYRLIPNRVEVSQSGILNL